MPTRTPDDLWAAVLGALEVQVSRANYNTWLKGTRGVAFNQGLFVVGAPSAFATAWLDRNMSPLIRKTLVKVVGQEVGLTFQVTTPSDAPATPATLLRPAGPVRVQRPLTDNVTGTPLNPRYSFDTFITGEANRFAFAASRAVAENPGNTSLAVASAAGHSYNPLFVYGGVGLGKTHLLHAIAHHCVQQNHSVLYITSEQFTNQFIHAVRERKTEDFRGRFRSVDVLLIDDIHFIADKEQTQESFFHTFNDLHNAGRQIVLSSDRPPASMPLLEDRLRSRFEWGLIADVQPPDLEVRMAILSSKADELGVSVPDDVLEFIAHRFQSNVRELEGALNRVMAKAHLSKAPVTLPLAQTALAELLSHRSAQPLSPERVLAVVAAHFRLAADDIVGPRRSQDLVQARHITMYLLRTEARLTLTDIGGLLGGRDHSTVLHGCDKMASAIVTNSTLRRSLIELATAARQPA